MSNPNVETVGAAGDRWMLVAALALVVCGLLGFYLLPEDGVVLRGLALIAGLAAGAAVALVSGSGKVFIGFAKESSREVRKVVWPSRKEATQTTAIVFAFMLIMAIFLWSADKLIEWSVFSLILNWK